MATFLDSSLNKSPGGQGEQLLTSLSSKSCLIAEEIDGMGQKGHAAGQRALVQPEPKKGGSGQPIVVAEKMEIESDPGSSSWGVFGKALQPLSWMKRQFQTVAKAVEYYRNSDLSFGRVVEMFSGLSVDDCKGIYELMTDYSRFKQEGKKGESQHPLVQEEWEKRAFDLYQRRQSLSPKEKLELKELMEKMHTKEVDGRKALFALARQSIDGLEASGKLDSLKGQERSVIQEGVAKEVVRITGRSEGSLTLDDHSAIELAVSRIIMLDLNAKAGSVQHVAFLAGMHKEHNRLQTKQTCFTGEDFLRVKVEQLNFLFEGLDQFCWTLNFVADEAVEDGVEGTIDVMRKMIAADPLLQRHAGQIILLSYEEDLREEISQYRDPALATADSNDFARRSVKGGAIQVGLRYLAHTAGDAKTYKTARPQAIIYTDCDTSINLGNSGILLNQIYNKGKDIGIGSRRIEGSHVIGKSAERHLQSYVFNMLVRVLLNVQVSDTQVGAKAIRPEVISKIHGGFSEISMAFDAELFKLAFDKECSAGEDGVVWTDSAIESQSATQGQNMFSGLLGIAQRMYPQPVRTEEVFPAEMSEKDREKALFERKASALAKEGKLFDSLLNLASNRKWHLIVKHSLDLYNTLSPKEWRQFVSSLCSFLCKLAANEVTAEDVQKLADQVIAIVDNFKESDFLAFFMKEFPEIFDVIELLHKDPGYAPVIVSMLVGDSLATRLISKLGFASFYDFKTAHPEIDGAEAFSVWIEAGNTLKKTEPPLPREPIQLNWERIDKGTARLEEMNQKLLERGETRKVAVVLQYNMDGTSAAFVDNVLGQKLKDLQEQFGHLSQIQWDVIVVDARGQRTSGIEAHIDQVLKANESPTVHGRQLVQDNASGKPSAVRFGMSAVADEHDFVSFIDFSDKISILEMGNLLADAFEQKEKGQEAVAIGSRRLDESEVVNKPLTFLLRSLGLNLMVKGMFPLLYDIYDTQTGFKLFTKDAWKGISGLGLQSQSLAFDIEILQQAARLGIPISECPVDFYDNTQNSGGEVGDTLVTGMFDDLLVIRGRIDDSAARPLQDGEAKLIGGGAENIVYRLSNGSIVKIPHENLDTDFIAVVKNFLLKNQKEMSLHDQQDKLITSSFINQLLTSPRISGYIPHLRNWKDLNIFVMKIITSIENKNYKSMGYETAGRLGKDLVIPFRFVKEPFTISVDGKEKTFTEEDHVKQSVFAKGVFKDRFLNILNSTASNPEKAAQIKQLIDEGLGLFDQLWVRGLFDLDTNFMCDTGYYPDSQGIEKLMVLDPGELIDDTSLVDVSVARTQVEKRYDYIEMEIFLRALPADVKAEVLDYYKQKMHAFIDRVEEDLQKPSDKRDFGKEQRAPGAVPSDFAVPFDPSLTLPAPKENGQTTGQKKREALELSRSGYQMPFSLTGHVPTPESAPVTVPFIHLVPEMGDYPTPKLDAEARLPTPVGCIGPTLEAVQEHSPEVFTEPQSNLIVLDAGTATRSSLLKYSEKSSSKGSIEVGGVPLYQRAAASVQGLVQSKLPEGYVVLTSSDDLIELSDEDQSRIAAYFDSSQGPVPGLFWFDLPDAGSQFFPLTVDGTYRFFKEHAQLPQRAEGFFSEIPITKGFVRNDRVAQVFSGIFNATDAMMQRRGQPAAASEGSSSSMPQVPGVSVLGDLYGQFVVYNAAERFGGMKTPFLLIFSKEFLNDFTKEALPLIPDYTYTHITWENILLRGIKADKQMWMQMGKPPQMDSKQWENLWDKIQELKARHHINTQDPAQNEARVFQGNWQNFDDPHAAFRYVQGAYSEKMGHTFRAGPLQIVSDQPLGGNNQVRSSVPGSIALMKSELHGNVELTGAEGRTAKTHEVAEVLFYNVNLPAGKTLFVPSNHLVVGIDGEIFSIRMGKMSKEELKAQMVYRYDGSGRPSSFMSYSDFTKKFGSMQKL